ncbi:MAG: hypothetical protein GX945_16005 [Lentisphaerae bacterium]|jgi:hypothetical protein|nr:hypothetical protein [Lentisphaerota bacterium]
MATTNNQNNQNILYREMLLDLCYRLRAIDDSFCRVGEALAAALAVDDFSLKTAAIAAMRDYATSLRVVHADYRQVLADGRQAAFPPEPGLWQWDESDVEVSLPLFLERLQAIGEGMETHLYSTVSRLEERP